MTYGINDTIEQVGKTTDYDKDFIFTTEIWKGTDTNIANLALTNRKGTLYKGGTVTSSVTEHIGADRSEWRVTYKKGKEGSTGDLISQVWSESMTQYTYPLEKFLSPDEAMAVEAWESQEGFELNKKLFKYTEQYIQGDEVIRVVKDLTDKALDVARMKYAGIQEVMRWYPQAVRVSVYKKKNSNGVDNLNHIDGTPQSQFPFASYPYSWLKSAYDWSENQDGTWTLNESWIGVPADDGGWNSNLYGPNAWKFYK